MSDPTLLHRPTLQLIEAAVSDHCGSPWTVSSTRDLGARSSHPAMIMSDGSYAVFAKLADPGEAQLRVDTELAGLRLIGGLGVAVPTPIGSGRVDLPDGSAVLVFEALAERTERTPEDWQAIGHLLAKLHAVAGEHYGAERDGFFGALALDNSAVGSDTWLDFYAVRRVEPYLRSARDVGAIDGSTVLGVESLMGRLNEWAGPEPGPRLLHGDAQHHNFVSTGGGAVVIDASPYFGHPELDLALLDYFSPVPPQVWSSYAEVRPIEEGFEQRRELWRIFAYLAILTVDGDSAFGRTFRTRLERALDRYA